MLIKINLGGDQHHAARRSVVNTMSRAKLVNRYIVESNRSSIVIIFHDDREKNRNHHNTPSQQSTSICDKSILT